MSDPIKDAVNEAAQEDLATRIRAKVREKWGKSPKDLPDDWELSSADMPRVLGVETEIDHELPSGMIQKVDREAMVRGDEISFTLHLKINGCMFYVKYAMSGQTMMLLKHTQAQEEIIRGMLDHAVRASTDLIRKGLGADLLRIVKEKGWDGVGGLGIFPFEGLK